MKQTIRLFAVLSAAFWLCNLIYHTMLVDARMWELTCYLGMYGLNIWLYEFLNDEKDIKEEN